MEAVVQIIETLGFPIACVLGLGYFCFWLVKKSNETNVKNMEQVQARCKEREERLYTELAEGRKINGQFAEILARYDLKLDSIQKDVEDIKNKMN